MRPAVIVVDMTLGNIKDGFDEQKKLVKLVADFLKKMRERSVPVVFACDSFLEKDFIFRGRMKPHALRGTEDTRPHPDLGVESKDIVIEKRRFSAFFKTDLDQTLRTLGVDTVLVCGINTHFCVLATAFDALANDFFTIILEDLSSAHKEEIHKKALDLYRSTAVYPLFRVMTSENFLREFDGQ